MLGCSGRTTTSPDASAAEGHPPGAVGDRDHHRHAAEHPLETAARGEGRERRALVLPEQHVVLEEHPVALAQVELGHRDQLALDLAGAVGEPELGHVLEPGRFLPPGVADQVAGVEGRTAGRAGGLSGVVLGFAPLTLDPVHGAGRYHRRGGETKSGGRLRRERWPDGPSRPDRRTSSGRAPLAMHRPHPGRVPGPIPATGVALGHPAFRRGRAPERAGTPSQVVDQDAKLAPARTSGTIVPAGEPLSAKRHGTRSGCHRRVEPTSPKNCGNHRAGVDVVRVRGSARLRLF